MARAVAVACLDQPSEPKSKLSLRAKFLIQSSASLKRPAPAKECGQSQVTRRRHITVIIFMTMELTCNLNEVQRINERNQKQVPHDT